jgi:hypothetical protein
VNLSSVIRALTCPLFRVYSLEIGKKSKREDNMRTGVVLTLLALAAGCSQTANKPNNEAKPELVGKVPSQPGNCFFRGVDGKAFVAAC